MNDNQLFEPGFFNKFVTEAYTKSVGNVEYLQILTEIPKIQNSQDILLNSLSFQDITEYTILYIIESLCDIFSNNKSIISKYASIFKDFFITILPRYPRTPAIINASSNLFVTIFKNDRMLAKNILLNINDFGLSSILCSTFVASTKSMNEFSSFFEKVIISFTNQNQNQIQIYMLFSRMLSSFKIECIPPQLIELILHIGGPKIILNAAKLMSPENASEFLKSLEVIICLPISAFKMEPVRLRYLIEFIEGTVDLLRNQQNGKIMFVLSFITLDLRNCSSIRSLKNIDFLKFWLNEIFQATVCCLNLDLLNSLPYCIENWMNFWSLTSDFQSFHENSEFKSFANQLIGKVINIIFPFLRANSSKVCEVFIQSDYSSNFFEYISKICQDSYTEVTNLISESFVTNGIEELMWNIELANKLINLHLDSAEYLKYIKDDIKLMKAFQNLSLSIQFNLNPLFEYVLISFYKSFVACYGKRQSKIIAKIFAENSDLFIYYLTRTINNLCIPDLSDISIRLFVDMFNFKHYPQAIANQLVENPEIIQKVIEMNFPFCFEKGKKVEAIKFYGYFFSLLSSNKLNIKIKIILDTILSRMSSIESIPFLLNIYGALFENISQDADLIYEYYFNNLLPIISNLMNIQDLVLCHQIAKFLSTIAKSNETMNSNNNDNNKNKFILMSPIVINLFKSTTSLMIALLKNSNCDDKVLHCVILTINSFIQNRSLNIGIMMAYKDFTFNQFLAEFLNLLSLKKESINQKCILDFFKFIDLLLYNFNALQQPYFDWFLFFLNNIVIKEISSFSKKGVIQCFDIFNQSFHLLEHLKENKMEMLSALLKSVLPVLPNVRVSNIDICMFYLNLFILTKPVVVQIIGSMYERILNEKKYSYLMQTLNELLNLPSFNIQICYANRGKFQKMLEYMKEPLSQPRISLNSDFNVQKLKE